MPTNQIWRNHLICSQWVSTYLSKSIYFRIFLYLSVEFFQYLLKFQSVLNLVFSFCLLYLGHIRWTDNHQLPEIHFCWLHRVSDYVISFYSAMQTPQRHLIFFNLPFSLFPESRLNINSTNFSIYTDIILYTNDN